jgi:hypothetical protein
MKSACLGGSWPAGASFFDSCQLHAPRSRRRRVQERKRSRRSPGRASGSARPGGRRVLRDQSMRSNFSFALKDDGHLSAGRVRVVYPHTAQT